MASRAFSTPAVIYSEVSLASCSSVKGDWASCAVSSIYIGGLNAFDLCYGIVMAEASTLCGGFLSIDLGKFLDWFFFNYASFSRIARCCSSCWIFSSVSSKNAAKKFCLYSGSSFFRLTLLRLLLRMGSSSTYMTLLPCTSNCL